MKRFFSSSVERFFPKAYWKGGDSAPPTLPTHGSSPQEDDEALEELEEGLTEAVRLQGLNKVWPNGVHAVRSPRPGTKPF